MNNDFDWNLRQVADSIKPGTLDCRVDLFYFPHESIWEAKNWQFTTEVADEIYDNLDLASQHLFLSVCLASHLLNRNKSPKYFPEWFKTKSTIKGLLGLDLSFDEMDSCLWGRAAIPGVDLVKGWNDQVLYAMVGSFRRDNKNNILTPDWTTNCMDAEARGSVQNAADLLGGKFPDTGFIFWPLLNPLEPSTSINGPSLGLPVYLSFLSVASNKLPLPAILATGELGATGDLQEVGGLKQKFGLAYEKGFTSFIYPLLPRVKAVETKDQVVAQGVRTLEEAKRAWFGDILPDNSKLLKLLMPLTYKVELTYFTINFTGRKWIFNSIEEWRTKPDSAKIFWLTAHPGIGKSAIAAQLCANYDKIIAFHFCDANSDEKRDPIKIIRSLAGQLVERLPEYASHLTQSAIETYLQECRSPYDLFTKLISEPLADIESPFGQTLAILVDGLDEATVDGKNPLADLISQIINKLPSWLRLIVTSRDEQELRCVLSKSCHCELVSSREETRTDVSDYLNKTLPEITPQQISDLLDRIEGNFLYARCVCEEIREGLLRLDRLEEFPAGLTGYYQSFFTRRFPSLDHYSSEIEPILRLMVAAFEPLSIELLQALLNIASKKELFRRLKLLGSIITRTGDSDTDVVTFFHLSLKDWLTDWNHSYDFSVEIKDGHRFISKMGWEHYKKEGNTIHSYFLAWLPLHLYASDRHFDAVSFLKDFDVMMARARSAMLQRMITDYLDIRSDDLHTEASFFRENAHILRRGDDAWSAYKILLQLSIEHANDSPLTQGAEKFLEAGKCDWPWIRRMYRPKNIRNIECLTVLEGHTRSIIGAKQISDGHILSWSFDGTIRIWDQYNLRHKTLDGHDTQVNGALQLPNGNILSWAHTLHLWSELGLPLAVLEGHSDRVVKAILLNDTQILSCSWDTTIRLWTIDGIPLTIFKGHTREVCGILQISGNRILSWSSDFTLRIWQENGMPLAVLDGHTDEVIRARQLPDNRILSWSLDKTLRLWTEEGVLSEVLRGHSGIVYGALVLPDRRIVSWSRDSTLRIWSENGNPISQIRGHEDSVRGALLLDDERILTWSDDGTLRLWNTQGDPLYIFEGHRERVSGASLLPNGNIMSWSSTLRIWSPNNCLTSGFNNSEHDNSFVDFFPNNKMFLYSSVNSTLFLTESDPLASIIDGSARRIKLSFPLSNGCILIDHIWINGIKLLELWSKDGALITVFKDHSHAIYGAILLNESKILTWSDDNNLRIWSNKGSTLSVLEGHSGIIDGALLLPNNVIISWSWDKTLRLWTMKGKLLAVLEGHTETVIGAIFLRCGHILSWSVDNTLRIWSENGIPLARLDGHKSSVIKVLELNNGNILSWAYDGTLRIWDNIGNICKIIPMKNIYDDFLVKQLANDTILTQSTDYLCLLSQDGYIISKHERNALTIPDISLDDLVECNKVVSRTVLNNYSKSILVYVKNNKYSLNLRWQGNSKCISNILFPNGTCLISDYNTYVLQIYFGSRPIAIQELEHLLEHLK